MSDICGYLLSPQGPIVLPTSGGPVHLPEKSGILSYHPCSDHPSFLVAASMLDPLAKRVLMTEVSFSWRASHKSPDSPLTIHCAPIQRNALLHLCWLTFWSTIYLLPLFFLVLFAILTWWNLEALYSDFAQWMMNFLQYQAFEAKLISDHSGYLS